MDKIVIHGARQHNLKNIDLELPKNKLIVITGPSGSGKSSLAFDTIYAEGQRRYVESLSAYARQFLGVMEKPDVDSIEGLSPAIAIDQKTTSKNPRSTVGTITEIYDYLRLLFARAGKPHCPECGVEISSQSAQEISESIMSLPEGTKIQIIAPIIRGQKGEHKDTLEKLKRLGYPRLRIDGEVYLTEEVPKLDKNKKHTIEVVIDRIVIKEGSRTRVNDSVEQALKLSDGLVVVNLVDEGKDIIYSEKFACPIHNFSIPELSPRLFSFNSPYGACPTCKGLGVIHKIDENLLIDEERVATEAFRIAENISFKYIKAMVSDYLTFNRIPRLKKFKELPQHVKEEILYGNGYFEGVIPHLERKFLETDNEKYREEIGKYIKEIQCPECKGARLRKEALTVLVNGKNIYDVVKMDIAKAFEFFQEYESVPKTEKEKLISEKIVKEIKERLKFLLDVGLDYLTLDRTATTLSGGESQRIRLATQIGSKLSGVLYVLDEPSIGLHPRDTEKLINTLKELRDLGNTVIVVEHDPETIEEADYIVDIGPGSGVYGGYITAVGTVEEIKNNPNSLTGKYLSGKLKIPLPAKRRPPNDNKYLIIHGAKEHNLKNIDVKIPLGLFVAITGVSGSGKSTLIYDILWQAAKNRFHGSNEYVGKHEKIEGWEHIDKVINVDQSPIGRTPRSNPATYTKVFDLIRELYASTPEAKIRGYDPGRFSFNVKGGRCEACQGEGVVKIEMHFLPDIYVTCEVCGGKRYNKETLSVLYKGKSIADVLDMTVAEALEFFENIPSIRNKLKLLHDVGLDYIKLGQPATTLSGGEAQRIKLSRELSKRDTGKTLYLLDEPTTGLHSHDVAKLIQVLNKLVEKGNTVVVIEHNLDVIKCADWIIDLGPEGGDRGGYIVAEGTPDMVANNEKSYTGKFLKKYLK
ncbi:MAG TPA: excinuclease ABC subunit UvrA [Sulfurihydrogenibium sp.]|uniref:excinuclease ABC subunit UvrA n=1 Tax=Sulfurihydrogenibium sp. (strain YO3AOP1) TaxID=436114 RepID=UPI0001723853|nr:excinuclease ABC subunit UvrA [Sulfurihydrogenibium sp. YO3AOP1]ACD65686.1 excinuclease ABC, A subunit [Sulfurihydrogenibium sp. YO3AOP1]HBT98456.1 excinuclease ABC subunit UvrA [Sulfurihydrogenibium sp.]